MKPKGRVKLFNLENVISTVCTICGMTRDEIEKQGQEFKYHIRIEHNVWKYVYYRVYLFNKNRSLYTGVEESIYEAIVSDNAHEWYPRTSFANEGASAGELRIEAAIREIMSEYLEKVSEAHQNAK